MDIDHKTEKEEQLERRKKVIFDMLNDKQYVPMKLKEMAMLLQIPKENRSELKAVLDALILEGKAEVTSKGKYRRATAKTVTGVFTAHPRGFGFVEVRMFLSQRKTSAVRCIRIRYRYCCCRLRPESGRRGAFCEFWSTAFTK